MSREASTVNPAAECKNVVDRVRMSFCCVFTGEYLDLATEAVRTVLDENAKFGNAWQQRMIRHSKPAFLDVRKRTDLIALFVIMVVMLENDKCIKCKRMITSGEPAHSTTPTRSGKSEGPVTMTFSFVTPR